MQRGRGLAGLGGTWGAAGDLGGDGCRAALNVPRFPRQPFIPLTASCLLPLRLVSRRRCAATVGSALRAAREPTLRATASVCPSAHASGVACLSGDPSSQARTRREAFAAGVASGTRCDSTASLCLQSQPAFKVKNVCAQSLGTRIRYAGDDAEDGPHTIGVSAHREQT